VIGGGFAYKTCQCEDFPCCGHNDVDPNWEPDESDMQDMYDEMEDFDDDEEVDEDLIPDHIVLGEN
jgi:hypothetical protein